MLETTVDFEVVGGGKIGAQCEFDDVTRACRVVKFPLTASAPVPGLRQFPSEPGGDDWGMRRRLGG